MTDETTAPEATEIKTRARKTPEATETALPEGHVRARVLPLGAGKIYTGDTVLFGHTNEDRFPTHARGDVLVLPRQVAQAQEDAGRLEIL